MPQSCRSGTVSTPTRQDVEAAWSRVGRWLAPTPLTRFGEDGPWFKLENLQVTGAYKVRGGVNAVAAAIERGDRRPLVVASAGNHGKGVAWAAQRFGLSCHVLVPTYAPAMKVEGARELGAVVTCRGSTFEEAEREARELAARHDWHFVHPFDDPDVIAGQGTIAAELDHVDLDDVYVPIGGGGLVAGMALWLRERGVRVIGVQVEGVDGMARALRGEPSRAPGPTIADGLAVRAPGGLATQICRDAGVEVVVVSEECVRRTMQDLLWRQKLVVEGAGAVAVAALPPASTRRMLAVVSGGNVDREVLRRVA